MAMQVVLRAGDIKLFIGGNLCKGITAVNYSIDYGEQEIYGIDSAFPQEIASTKVVVRGTVSGTFVRDGKGLQGMGIKGRNKDILTNPYVSLRIQERLSGKDMLWVPEVKISNERVQAAAKDLVRFSFEFKGIIPFQDMDK